MSSEEDKMVAIGSILEGEATVARNLGAKREISEMEMIILVNLAQLALYRELSLICEEDQAMRAKKLAEAHVQACQELFGSAKRQEGFKRLIQAGVALLTTERFEKYLVTSIERRNENQA